MTLQESLTRYGDAENCRQHLERSRRELLLFMESLPDGQFFQRSAPGVWSPAELAEHIALTEEGASRVIRRLRKVVQGQAELPPPLAKSQFGANGKPLAPEGVRPSAGLSREQILERLASVRERVWAEADESGPLLEHPTTYGHPFFGDLNALGWLQTLVYHERHHLKQMQERAQG